jgi:tRNA A-37 threonylcarbamoyl transferase component Bud32
MHHYHAVELSDKHLDPATPFQLELSPDGAQQSWRCVAILRHLPGKRLVLHLQRDSQQVLCKLFYRGRDYQREIRGHQQLQRGGINTPALLQHYSLALGQCKVILYQYIPGDTLENLNQQQSMTANSPAVQSTVSAVAAMHRLGLRQVDIHLGNFLYRHAVIYVVDTAAIRQHASPLRGKLALENLGDLLAQFQPGQIDELASICNNYRQHNPAPGWQARQLPAAVTKMRLLRWRHYRRKLSRNCSEFICRHGFDRLAIWRRQSDSPALQAKLENPDIAIKGGDYLKQGNTATVASARIDGQPLVIKRYNIKNWRHRLSRCWRPTRAWHSWHNAHYLLFNGLQTPQPIALVEERWGPFRGRAFFVCSYAPGEDLKTALNRADQQRRSELLHDFAGIVRAYLQAGISHGDMKADNFIVTAAGVTIIDLDPMQHHHRQAALVKALRRDVRRFLDNFSGAQGEDIARQLLAQLPEALRP